MEGEDLSNIPYVEKPMIEKEKNFVVNVEQGVHEALHEIKRSRGMRSLGEVIAYMVELEVARARRD